jgi:glutathione-regulated potassium-efflux system ancillary protein KefC
MQWVGLSMALGAFLAGVLLADSEYRRELETDIEPFKGLLLGLFFIAVGMSIDFGVLLASPGLMAALLGFLALKMLTIAALARLLACRRRSARCSRCCWRRAASSPSCVSRRRRRERAAGRRGVAAGRRRGAVDAADAAALVAVDRWLLPRYANCGRPPAPPELSEPQSAPVIIAGFGRYGQIVGRLLGAEGVAVTVLDHAPR